MTDPQAPTIELSDGHRMPALGFGTWPLTGDDGTDAVRNALDTGYRLLDTAARYLNEDAVGRAIADGPTPRGDIFLTSKLRGDDHGYDAALRACEESLQRLGSDYLDLYLIHWPLPRLDKYVDSWRALVELRERGLVRSIGVSNFTGGHIDRIVDATGVPPVVNQIELHPLFPQSEQRAYDSAHGIVTQSWSPLGRGSDLLGSDVLAGIAAAHGVSVAQVVLRWHHELGAVPIPKSGDAARMRENLDVFGFTLGDDDHAAIARLDTGRRVGGDPDVHEEF